MNNKGSKYYNNGIVNKMIKDGDPIPEGFVLGMKKRSSEEKRLSNEKRKQTNIKKYGGPAPQSSKVVREKTKQTNLSKYGVENPRQSKEVKDRAKETNLRRYGVENVTQVKEVRDKMRKACLDKYGVENVFQSNVVKEKIKDTNLERYGVEHPLQSKEILDKAHNTILDRYGVEHALLSEDLMNKSKGTLLKNYGVENPMFSPEIKGRVKTTIRERYGVDNLMQSQEIKNKIRKTNLERYGVSCPFLLLSGEQTSHYRNSKPNLAFSMLLDDRGITYSREFLIVNRYYDFKVRNILIEIDPFPTHNTLWNPYGDKRGIPESYHYDKSHLAEENGYQCIHIFDWDDVDKIIRLLQDRETIYARKCEIREVSMNNTAVFLNQYHLQGSCKGQSARLGLYYNNELVSLMTFGKPRYNKNYEWELLRYCSSYNVIGVLDF